MRAAKHIYSISIMVCDKTFSMCVTPTVNGLIKQ